MYTMMAMVRCYLCFTILEIDDTLLDVLNHFFVHFFIYVLLLYQLKLNDHVLCDFQVHVQQLPSSQSNRSRIKSHLIS
jgi:hypothetical protein